MSRKSAFIGAVAFAATVSSASAVAVTLDFNSLPGGAGNASVQTYLNGQLGPGMITVTGAATSRTYAGDGYVYSIGGRYITLGTTDGATSPTDSTHFDPLTVNSGYDTFIYNAGSNPSTKSKFGTPGGDKITMAFKIPILSISFDWEVFPNGDCGTCTSSSPNWPDFELFAGMVGDTTPTDSFTGDTIFPVAKYNPATKSGTSTYAQGLGTFSASFSRPKNYVEFVDWPDRIGIDRLDPTTVPEPGSLLLVGIGIAGLGLRRKRGAAS